MTLIHVKGCRECVRDMQSKVVEVHVHTLATPILLSAPKGVCQGASEKCTASTQAIERFDNGYLEDLIGMYPRFSQDGVCIASSKERNIIYI